MAPLNAEFLIWSNEHRAWWKPARRGYTKNVADAGQYSEKEAIEICRDALPSAMHVGVIAEVPVPTIMMSKIIVTSTGFLPGCIFGE